MDYAELLARIEAVLAVDPSKAALVDDVVREQTGGLLSSLAELRAAARKPSALESGARGIAQGATFGFADELAGVGAALIPGGRGYGEARDESRRRFRAAREANPGTYLAGEIAGSVLPAVAGGSALAIRTARPLMSAFATGAGLGAVQGLGTSEAPLVSGESVARTAGGAALGAGGSLAGSALATGGGRVFDRVLTRLAPERAMRRAVSEMVTPQTLETVEGMARVGLDMPLAETSPFLANISGRGIGAEPGLAAETIRQIDMRQAVLEQARKLLGERYQEYSSVPLIVDQELAKIFRAQAIPMEPGQVISFETIRRMREGISRRLREGLAKGTDRHELGQLKEALTGWMRKAMPELREVDEGYARVLDALDMAEISKTSVIRSGMNYAANRGFGVEAGSIGGSLPQGSRGWAMAGLETLFGGDRGRAAELARRMMIDPSTPAKVRELLAEQAFVRGESRMGGILLRSAAGPGLTFGLSQTTRDY